MDLACQEGRVPLNWPWTSISYLINIYLHVYIEKKIACIMYQLLDYELANQYLVKNRQINKW